MKKLDRHDVKSPDKFQQELQKGFQWTTKHSKLVGILALAFLVVGAGLSAKSYLDEKKENELQAQYYQIEKQLIDKKTALTENKSVKATGDYEKDFGSVVTDFKKLIAQAPKTKAAKMAALQLSDLQLEHNKTNEALETLQKVDSSSKDLLSGLVQVQLGTVQANMNDCNSAISTWSKIFTNAGAKSLHTAVKLKTGLCYEAMNDFAKAEQAYNEVKAGDSESAAARSAEKYLKLLSTTAKK